MFGQRGFMSGLLTGAIGTIALLSLSPVTRRYMRPVIQAVLDQTMDASQRLQRSVYQIQEDVEDFMAEARQNTGDSRVALDGGYGQDDAGHEGWS